MDMELSGKISKQIATLLVAILVMAPARSQAQTWSMPGYFDVVIPKGWVQFQPTQLGTRSRPILLIAPKEKTISESTVGCGIYKLDHTAVGEVAQATVNAVLQGWDQGEVIQQAEELGGRVFDANDFSNKLRNGVQTVSLKFSVDLKGRQQRVLQTQFMLAIGGANASFLTASCFAPINSSDADLRQIESFLSSLTFKQPAKPE